jgi:hypothetical protein
MRRLGDEVTVGPQILRRPKAKLRMHCIPEALLDGKGRLPLPEAATDGGEDEEVFQTSDHSNETRELHA